MWNTPAHERMCTSISWKKKKKAFEMASPYYHKMHTPISGLKTFTFMGRTVRIKSVGKWAKNWDNTLFDTGISLKMKFPSCKN